MNRDELYRRVERLERLMLIPSQQWISVDDSVPPEGVRVILYTQPLTDPRLSAVIGCREGRMYRVTITDEEWVYPPTYWMHMLQAPPRSPEWWNVPR